MRSFVWFLQLISIIVAALNVAACSPVVSRETSQWTPTPITDLKSVAGRWEGLMIRTPRSPSDDWVRLVIREGGAYEFASYRTIGVLSGTGTFTLADGKLSAQSERGKMTLQLYTDAVSGVRMLKAEALTGNRIEYSAELKRTGD